MKEARDKFLIQHPEAKDRFMELMEKRHEAALTAMKAEAIISQEVAVQIKIWGEHLLDPITDQVEKEIERHIKNKLANFPEKTIFKKQAIAKVIENYLFKKAQAEAAEEKLEKRIIHRGLRINFKKVKPGEKAEILGRELFKLKTKSHPKDSVDLLMREGYLIIFLHTDEDYKKFKGSESDSGGEFHESVHISEIESDILVVKGEMSSPLLTSSVVSHERQHFINHSMFSKTAARFGADEMGKKIFGDLENQSTPYKNLAASKDSYDAEVIDVGLRKIKDEVLSYIRDGSSANIIVGFLNMPLYAHLVALFTEE